MAIVENTRVCLDTNVIIDFLRGKEPRASAVEKVVREADCFLSTISVCELLFGVARAKKKIGEGVLLGLMNSPHSDYRNVWDAG